MPLHGVFRGLLNGIQERGEGGFLYVKEGNCRYMFPSEVTNEDVRASMEAMFADESADNVFFVAEERDSKLNLLAYPRNVVANELSAHVANQRAALEEDEERIVEDEYSGEDPASVESASSQSSCDDTKQAGTEFGLHNSETDS